MSFVLKNNFERLECLFQDSLEEVNQVKSEDEAKLIEANDNLRIAKAENEELKEKVDVLFKLGRSYINKKDRGSTEQKQLPANVPRNNEDTIETVTIEEVSEDDLQTWTQNKLRGFRRAGPKAPPARNSNTTKHEAQGPKNTQNRSAEAIPPPSVRPSGYQNPQASSVEEKQERSSRKLY